MKNILNLLYIVTFAFLMYWLGTRAVPKHPAGYSPADPALQAQFLAAILNGAANLPTEASAENWKATVAQWEQAENNLETWCAANGAYPLESLARVAWANCAVALDALQSTREGDEMAQEICGKIMARAAARNAQLLALLVRP